MSETDVADETETAGDIDWSGVLDGVDDTEPTSEAPAEPTEPEASQDATADDAEPELPRRDTGRDEKGRFKPKAETVVATDTVPPVTEPVVEAPVATPFSLKVSGKDIAIEGATYTKGVGLTIPEAHLPAAQRTLQNGLYYEQHWKQIEETAVQKGYEKAMAIRGQKEEQASLALAELEQIVSSEEALLEFAQRLATEGPLLLERARARALEARIADMESASQPAPEDVETQRNIQIATVMDEELGTLFQSNPAVAQLFADAQERDALEGRLWDLHQAFVTPKGFDVVKFRKQIEYEASLRSRAREQAEEAKKAASAAQKAAQFNAANRTPAPPAGTGARSAPARTTTTTAPSPTKDYRDFKREFLQTNPFEDE